MQLLGNFILYILSIMSASPSFTAADSVPGGVSLVAPVNDPMGFPAGCMISEQISVERVVLKVPKSLDDTRDRLFKQVGGSTPLNLADLRVSVMQGKAAFEKWVNDRKGPSGFLLFQALFHGNWFSLYGYDDNTPVCKNMTTMVIGNPLYLKDIAKNVKAGYGPFLVKPDRVLLYDVEGQQNECYMMWDRTTTDTSSTTGQGDSQTAKALQDQENKWLSGTSHQINIMAIQELANRGAPACFTYTVGNFGKLMLTTYPDREFVHG